MFKRINTELLPLKGHYFFWNAGTGPVVSYLSVYARQLGFSSFIVGIIYTILPICGMIVKPVVGGISDKFFCQKKIFLFAQLLTAAAFMAILHSPSLQKESRALFSCEYGEVVFNTINPSLNEGLLSNIQNESKIAKCELLCKSNPEYWNMVCKDSSGTIHCDTQDNATTILISAYVPTSLTIRAANSVIFRIANISINNEALYKPRCDIHVTTACSVKCSDHAINELLAETKSDDDDDVTNTHQFWLFLILMIIGWSGQAIVVSVGDAICFGMLGNQPEKYGYQRLFGSLGWGLFSTLGGFLIDSMSEDESQKDYSGAFYLAVSLIVVDFIVSCTIKYKQQKMSAGILRDVSRLLVDVRILVFILWCVLVGMCTGLIWNFLFWLIEDLAKNQGPTVLNNIKTLEGLVMAIQCLLGEMPFFFLSGMILRKIGHVHTMSLVLLAIGCRFILYSVISNPWWFLPVELTNGLTFGLFYACMASYASIVAPAGTEATMQGLVGAVFEGVGVSLGSLLAGTLFDQYGGPYTFRIFGIGALIACLVHAGLQYLISLKDFQTKYVHPKEALSGLDDDDQEAFTFAES